MKKLFYMLCVALTVLFAGCQNNGGDEIVFDHELPLFELKEDAILLEVLMPAGTKQEEELYIVGEFNGGEGQALGNMMWQLEPSSNIKKWGIYLYPETFVEGKSLADGYYFYSKQQGKERTVKNEDILHYETAEPGQRVNNIMVSRWEKFFLVTDDTIEHDGYVAYVIDETSWGGDLALYAWGDAEAFGGWPGKQPDGQEVINDVMYTYFDLGEANTGLNLNLIFNNNGDGKQLADYTITVGEDIFLRLTDDGVESLAEPLPTTDGYALFVDNQAGWEALALYVWGGTLGNDGIGGWPGMQPTATCKYKGVEYTYFDLGAGNNGKDGNFIINDNGAGNQTADIAWTLDKNLFVRIYADKSYVEVDPENPNATVDPEPEPEPEPDPSLQVAHKIYVNNQTSVEDLYVYAWGDAEIFGAWAGQQLSGNETIDGVDYVWVETAAEYGGKSVNLIFSDGVGNGNGGWQIDGPYVALTKDYYLTVTDDAVTEVGGTVEPAPTDGVWGIAGEFNGWSATECVALTEGTDGWWSIEGQELTAGGFKFVRDNAWTVNYGLATGVVFALDTELSLAQDGENLVVEAGKYNISLNPESALCKVTLVGTVEPTPTPDAGYSVYVDDQTEWTAIAAHVYTAGGYTTAWPGILPEAEPVEKDGVSYKQFITSSEVKDQAVNIIFNNNGGGIQLADYHVTLDKDIYLTVTATAVTPVGGTVEPNPEEAVHKIYVYNKSSHKPLYVYAYGDAEVFGGWAGQAQKGTETINGVEYAYFEVYASGADKTVNLIFSDGVGGETGWQINGPTNVILNKDYYYRVNDEVCVEISTDAPDAEVDIVCTYSIYVKNGSGWNPLYLYSWGDGVAQDGLGAWPGMKQTEEVNIDGTNYTRFAIPDALIGSSMHLIFNNGKGGTGGQFDGPFVTFQNDLYYEITSTTCTAIAK